MCPNYFSDLLEATIPSGSYDFILNILFPASEIPDAVRTVAKGDEVRYQIRFRNPHVKVSDRVDHKKVKTSVNAEVDYSDRGRVVHRETQKRHKELDYASFFDQVIRALGQEKLLDMVNRIGRLRWYADRGAGG